MNLRPAPDQSLAKAWPALSAGVLRVKRGKPNELLSLKVGGATLLSHRKAGELLSDAGLRVPGRVYQIEPKDKRSVIIERIA